MINEKSIKNSEYLHPNTIELQKQSDILASVIARSTYEIFNMDDRLEGHILYKSSLLMGC